MLKKIVLIFSLLLMANFCLAATLEEQLELTGIGPKKTDYKDPGHAAKLAFNFSPIAFGQFYVGEWKKGIWFTMGETVLLAGVVLPVYSSYNRNKKDLSPTWTTGNVILASLSFVGYATLKVWSSYEAGYGAERFNRIHKSAALFLRFGPKSVQLCWRYGF